MGPQQSDMTKQLTTIKNKGNKKRQWIPKTHHFLIILLHFIIIYTLEIYLPLLHLYSENTVPSFPTFRVIFLNEIWSYPFYGLPTALRQKPETPTMASKNASSRSTSYHALPWISPCRCWLSGFPGENPPANAGDLRNVHLIPGFGRFPWKMKRQSTHVFLPGKSHG